MQTHKLLILLVIGALLVSVLSVSSWTAAEATSYLYGDTTVFELNDRPLNITAAINSLKTVDNQTVADVTLKVLSTTYDYRGEVISLDQFHRWREAGVLQYYLLAGLTVDFNRQTTMQRMWPASSNLTGIELDNSIAAFYNHTTYFALNQDQNVFTATITLPNLSEGTHNVTFWATLEQNYLSYSGHVWSAFAKTVSFTVDTVAPEVKVESPLNQSHTGEGIQLVFWVSEPASKISYSIDGASNVTVTGNITLHSSPTGEHNVTVYAWDEAGNVGASETFNFTVDPPAVWMPVAAVAVVGLAVLGVILWRRRRPKSSG